jgi:hypothetical protein
MTTVSNGFWDLPAPDRDAAMQAACDRYGAADFFDLDAAQRRAVYDAAAGAWYGGAS